MCKHLKCYPLSDIYGKYLLKTIIKNKTFYESLIYSDAVKALTYLAESNLAEVVSKVNGYLKTNNGTCTQSALGI